MVIYICLVKILHFIFVLNWFGRKCATMKSPWRERGGHCFFVHSRNLKCSDALSDHCSQWWCLDVNIYRDQFLILACWSSLSTKIKVNLRLTCFFSNLGIKQTKNTQRLQTSAVAENYVHYLWNYKQNVKIGTTMVKNPGSRQWSGSPQKSMQFLTLWKSI